jgi:hypothetical protein
MLTIKKFIGLPALLLGVAGAVTVMGVSSPVLAAECNPLSVVGSYGTVGTTGTTDTMGTTGTTGTSSTMGTTGGTTDTSNTVVTRTISSPGTGGMASDWNTDFSVPAGSRFNGFVARMTSKDAGAFPVKIFLKYSDNTTDTVLDQTVSLNAGETKSLKVAPRTNVEPVQVSTVVGSPESAGKTYTVSVDGCYGEGYGQGYGDRRVWRSGKLYYPLYGPNGRYPYDYPVQKTWWN